MELYSSYSEELLKKYCDVYGLLFAYSEYNRSYMVYSRESGKTHGIVVGEKILERLDESGIEGLVLTISLRLNF